MQRCAEHQAGTAGRGRRGLSSKILARVGLMSSKYTTTWALPCASRGNSTRPGHNSSKRSTLRSQITPTPHNNLGNMFREQVQARAGRGRGIEQAIALRPDYAEAYNNLGYTLDQLGKRDEAAARYAAPASVRLCGRMMPKPAQQLGQCAAKPRQIRRSGHMLPTSNHFSARFCRSLQQPGHRLLASEQIRRHLAVHCSV